MNLHVIVACHNRRETTIGCLSSLYAAAEAAGVGVSVTLFDDGSKDGTAKSVSTKFPSVDIIIGNGSAFWARSMHEAESRVLKSRASTTTHDGHYIVWLNDDVVLDTDSLIGALQTARAHSESIVVCAVRDPQTHQTTYSGFVRPGHHPLRLKQVEPGSDVQPVDTFNGNLVLVPLRIAATLGSIDGDYAHALADIDYGYRAKRAGIPVVLAPGTYGVCPRNPPQLHQGLLVSWRSFVGTKGGGHPKSLMKILRLGSPSLWPCYMGATYVLWWLRALRRQLTLK